MCTITDRDETDLFGRRLKERRAALAPAASRVVSFIDQNRGAVLASSAAQLAARLETSDATVIRAVQALGFEGLPDLKQTLATALDRRATPADDMRRTLAESGENAERAIDLVLDAHWEAMSALRSNSGRGAIVAAVSALHPADRICVFGIGPSAHLARYVSLLLVRSGRRATALDATGWALADQLLGLQARDALLLLAYGRPYREITATMREGRRLRLPAVLVTDTTESAIARRADVVVLARRGRAERVAIHAATLAALEAVVLGLAACDRDRAIGTLDRLNELRKLVSGVQADPGRVRTRSGNVKIG